MREVPVALRDCADGLAFVTYASARSLRPFSTSFVSSSSGGRMTVSLVASSGESVVQASVSTPKAKMREQTLKLRISQIDKFQTVCLLHVLQAIVQSRLPNTLFAALFKSSHGAEQPAVEDVEDEGFADDDVPEQTGELE